MEQRPVCLSIGGSDSCGGAGIQADLRIFSREGVLGCSAITALTAQHPARISRIEPVSLAQLDAEIHAVFDYYDVAAVKTGMLLDAEHIAVVAAALQQRHLHGTLVVDPVMVASSGRRLLDAGAVHTLVHALLPQATLLTPNLDEAAVLLARPVTEPREECRILSERLGCPVLLKGGHGSDSTVRDILCDAGGNISVFEHPRLPWDEAEAHGSGCRLSASITAILAADASLDLRTAVDRAITTCGFSQ